MKLLESGEMYLENILTLSKTKPTVRSIDVAEQMQFSKPSVSRAMNKLKDEEYILIAKDGSITLTEKGQSIAEKIYERHTLLTRFLCLLGVDEKTAAIDACKMEHDISDETFKMIKKYIDHSK